MSLRNWWIFSLLIFSLSLDPVCAADSKLEKASVQEAKKLLDDGFDEQAVSKLDPLLDQDSDNWDARLTRGIALYNLNRNYSALDDLTYLVDHKPDSAPAWRAIGRAYQKINRLDEAINAYKQFIKLDPKNQEADQYATLISVLEQQKKDKPGSVTGQPGKQYLADATAGGVMKWPATRLPLNVYITPGKNVPGYKPVYEDLLRQALDEWTTATGGKLKFVITRDPAKARMTCLWTDDLHAPSLTPEAGKAEVHEDVDGIDSAEVKLLTHSPFPDEQMTNDLMHDISLHEVGHALGLVGHSPNEDDIMFPKLALQKGVSPGDAATIMALYGWGPADGTAATVKNLTPALQSQQLTREGTKAAMVGDFPLAMEKLEQALVIDPTIKVARENLSVAANNIAIKEQDPKEMIRLLHVALYWNPESDLSRKNLNASLSNQGSDPTNFAQRVKLGDLCSAQHDLKGAIVEYSEAMAIKNDPLLSAKVAAMKKSLEKAGAAGTPKVPPAK